MSEAHPLYLLLLW